MSVTLQVFGRRNDDALHALRRPAAENLQEAEVDNSHSISRSAPTTRGQQRKPAAPQ
jgi:hypothetical protein